MNKTLITLLVAALLLLATVALVSATNKPDCSHPHWAKKPVCNPVVVVPPQPPTPPTPPPVVPPPIIGASNGGSSGSHGGNNLLWVLTEETVNETTVCRRGFKRVVDASGVVVYEDPLTTVCACQAVGRRWINWRTS